MQDPQHTYRLLADTVLLLHFAVVVFVVGGLVAVCVGNVKNWRWVNSPVFRLAHVTAIAIAVAQAWLGQLCPLTILESWLREQAGEAAYAASFIEHWVQRVLYYEAPLWALALAYSVFGSLVVATWWYFPPRKFSRHRHASGA
ncbi:DUF2784 domain-containing protein [Immundisolibacter sp.]|uniref:DUF2784 domain-containing protein n=1 Tax=Immundisolibacter sp. TaxID=1934948 RepID=UPI0035693F3C